MALTFASNGLLSKPPASSSSVTSNDSVEPQPFLSNGLLIPIAVTTSESLSAPFDASLESLLTRELWPNGLVSSGHEGGVPIPSAHSIDALLADDEMDEGMSDHHFIRKKGAN
jgi:hypothetical protein